MMQAYSTLWHYFLQTSFPLKCILMILCITSAWGWIFIFQRLFFLKSIKQAYIKFEKEFWSDIKLTELYEALPDSIPSEYLSAIFYAGFAEFCRLRNSGCQTLRVILEGVERAMLIAQMQAELQLERHLYWLAILGPGAAYLGLIGTLLGIISALTSLGDTGPNALLLIAPGIAEALIISVASLFTTLPILAFYHYNVHKIDQFLSQYNIFRQEFVALLLRQAYEEQHEDSLTT